MAKVIALLIFGALFGAGAVYLASSSARPDSAPATLREDSLAPPAAGQSDSAVVLADVMAMDPGPEQRSAALDLLETIGNDAAGIARIAAVLPAADRFAFEADALAALAERDLAGALSIAMAREGSTLKRLLLVGIGEGAARNDPVAALAAAAAIGDLTLRSGFTLGILNAWAELDPAGLLAYLETADPNTIRAPVPFDRLVAGDPEGVLAQLDRFGGTLRPSIERAALLALAEMNALGALARIEGMPAGRDRNQLVQAVAETYGRQDPAAALAWAGSLSPPSQDALNGVVNGIATVDVNRAVDWVLRELASPSLSGLDAARALPISPIFLGLRNGTLQMPLTADRLLAAENPTLKSRATAALMVWSQSNPREAADFALARLDRLTPADLSSLAMQTATVDFDVARSTAQRLPPEYQAVWVAGVADALVRTRPERALSFLAERRGQPGYEEGVIAVVRQLASADAPAAARLLADTDPSPQIDRAAATTASAWARQDPEAAAAWALAREEPQAVGAVASQWAGDDAGAAERWALSLPSGEIRDAGITGLLAAAANVGEFDASLLDSLSSEAVRQQSASRSILQIASRDPVQARQLMEVHVTDPDLRQQTEQQLTQLERMGAAGGLVPNLPSFRMPQ